MGQPTLIGSISIEKNEILSNLLNKFGVRHEILNAKNHEREGAIIAQAGKAGRDGCYKHGGSGVDIVLAVIQWIREIKSQRVGRASRHRHGKARSQKN